MAATATGRPSLRSRKAAPSVADCTKMSWERDPATVGIVLTPDMGEVPDVDGDALMAVVTAVRVPTGQQP